ncbi:MAG: hypothetical protein OXU77_20650 [Gammaproteobacteria bacterium]|nr:hypothetical protein [Gammaproteobacteria bacterium]
MGNNDDRVPPRGYRFEKGEHLVSICRVEGPRRFIGEYGGSTIDQGAGNADALLLAA